MKKFLMRQRTAAYNKNKENILRQLEVNKDAKFLDLGCDDGIWTMKLAKKNRTKNVSGYEDSWQHQRIFTIRGLKHLSELFGFDFEEVLASGYYPFGNLLSSIDKRHSAFISVKIRKL